MLCCTPSKKVHAEVHEPHVGPASAAAGTAAHIVSAAKKMTLGKLKMEVVSLKQTIAAQEQELSNLRRHNPGTNEFVVAQYNVLAGYLGDNRQPWFMYGIPLEQSRRDAILKKFYEKGPDGKYCNVGWPNYVQGILTPEEMAKVEATDNAHFKWEVRKDKLLRVIQSIQADVLSLVECDNFEDFFEPAMKKMGYGAVYKQRPRKSSHDGCAIFYRLGVFSLEATDSFEFVDRVDHAGRAVKDRVGLVALLKHMTGRRLIFISTHLARNPEDPRQTSSRAKQTAQLLKGLTDFAAAHDALHDPVILAGDLNTTNIRQIASIARVVFELCSQEVHPFIFTASAPRSLPTSVTTTRKMCIDYLFVQSSLDIIDRGEMPSLTMEKPIPNAEHPSDHLPLVFTIAFKKQSTLVHALARAWALVVLQSAGARVDDADASFSQPLTLAELATAFFFFDVQADGLMTTYDLQTGLGELRLGSKLEPLLAALQKVAVQEGSTFDDASPLPYDLFLAAYLGAYRKQKEHFRQTMKDAFAYFDTSGDGRLEKAELFSSFAAVCPFDIGEEDFDQVFQQLDANGDGAVDSDEFLDHLISSQLSLSSASNKRAVATSALLSSAKSGGSGRSPSLG